MDLLKASGANQTTSKSAVFYGLAPLHRFASPFFPGQSLDVAQLSYTLAQLQYSVGGVIVDQEPSKTS